MQQSARSPRTTRRPQKSRLVDVGLKDNLRALNKLIGPLDNSMKSKLIKPALKLAADIVAERAKANIKAMGPHATYSGAVGDSRKTKTREKWSVKTAAERAGGQHSDLSKSIKVKQLKIIRRIGSPVVVMVGPEWKKFSLGHLLEFGTGGYEKPKAHFLWSKEKDPALNDIAKIRPMPFLEPAVKSTMSAQKAIIAAYIRSNWTRA